MEHAGTLVEPLPQPQSVTDNCQVDVGEFVAEGLGCRLTGHLRILLSFAPQKPRNAPSEGDCLRYHLNRQ